MRRATHLLIALLCCANSVLAHPGHGTTDPGTVTHQVTEPFHLLPVVATASAIALLWTLARSYGRRSR